jgi:hypothetical protein
LRRVEPASHIGKYQVSGFRCQVRGVRCQVPGVKCLRRGLNV